MAKTISQQKEQKLRDILFTSYKKILLPRMIEAGANEEICEENARLAIEDILNIAVKPFSAERVSEAFNYVVMRDASHLEGAIFLIKNADKIGYVTKSILSCAIKTQDTL